ncbi:hypothetical protein F383_16792 [Gossypium arboreum]|uniref:Uncharacterized protein n=1 Tax=Gossypium arboreum TaxID=29729 RepID=A0A0B0NK48_GOSAR|nr:hypothetical protein F383_16792 [Gossypium arboreum]
MDSRNELTVKKDLAQTGVPLVIEAPEE